MSLGAASLLYTWEVGATQSPTRRALMLLEASFPEEAADELTRLPIGERDARLLTLRESAFGPRLECFVCCPACEQALDLSMSVSDIRVAQKTQGLETQSVHESGYEVRFRLPSSADLLAIESLPDEAQARRLLLDRCVSEARRRESPVPLDELPASVLAVVVQAMDAADPQANIEIALDCPECSHAWRSCFDVVSYLWTELDSWARQTLQEVHTLASAYGWRETEILAMSARRRRIYLDLVGR